MSAGLVGRFGAEVGSTNRLRSRGRGSRPKEPQGAACGPTRTGWSRGLFGSQESWVQTLQLRELRLTERKFLSHGHTPQTDKGIKTKVWERI